MRIVLNPAGHQSERIPQGTTWQSGMPVDCSGLCKSFVPCISCGHLCWHLQTCAGVKRYAFAIISVGIDASRQKFLWASGRGAVLILPVV